MIVRVSSGELTSCPVCGSALGLTASRMDESVAPHMNSRRPKAVTYSEVQSNPSPFLRRGVNRSCRYSSMPDESSVFSVPVGPWADGISPR